MRVSGPLLIAALASSGFCQNFTTLKSFLDFVPSCGRSCAATALKEIATGCSGDEEADIQCICQSNGISENAAQANSRKTATCAEQNCNDSDTLTLGNDFLKLASFCLDHLNGTASIPSTPSLPSTPSPKVFFLVSFLTSPSSLTLNAHTHSYFDFTCNFDFKGKLILGLE